MGLRDCVFQGEYRSGEDDLIRDFYHVALAAADRYWRAVGFFSSSALEAIGRPLGDFVLRGGEMRLITSVRLQEGDVLAIQRGLDRKEVCEKRLLEQIKTEFAAPLGRGASLLTALLEAGKLEIQIAIPTGGRGIYHEKVGVFLDAAGEYVSFSGSSNESRSALEVNYECVDVYPAWEEAKRALAKRRHFERLWARKAPGAETMDFPEAVKRELIRKYREEAAAGNGRATPADSHRWRHQVEAVELFLEHRRGVLEMATGAGKTRTALLAFERLSTDKAIQTAIVTTDGTDLLDQWSKQLDAVASASALGFRVLRHYGTHHQRDEYELEPSGSILVISRQALASVLRRLKARTKRLLLLVHDEVHGLGSPGNIEALTGLSDDIPYRLGLSATPEREYDQDGTAFIEQHVGPVIYRFPLDEAIRRGILCEFDYHPLEYELTEEDQQRLRKVYRQQAARQASGEPMSDAELYTALARVYKTSPAKLPLFEAFLAQHPDVLERCLVFVAEREYGDAVLEIIHGQRPDFHTYYADDDRQNLVDFARGRLNCLVTCHRISQGIDIRSVRSIVLFASDRGRLESIQRIGRCLRTDPADPGKRAMVVDFIRTQSADDKELNADQERRIWLAGLSQVRREEE